MSIVDAITRLNMTGNVIPNTWWSRITMPSGKPDCNAVVILSEIVYWYRARIVRDESTGRVLRVEKRFKADKLQRTYQSIADQFGFTKRQVQEAMYRLRDAGLITLELRTLHVEGGVTVSNVLFIEPVPEKIEEITTLSRAMQRNETGDTNQDTEGEVSHYNVQPSHVSACTPITLKRETNTEITTETTTEIKTKNKNLLSQNAFASFDDDCVEDDTRIHPDAAVQTDKGKSWGTVDDLAAAQFIFKKILVVNSTAKEPNWAQWANDIRLMRVQDKRTHREICELFKWANQDTFWSRNVLSPRTLRKQWDRLTLQRAGRVADSPPRPVDPPMPRAFGEEPVSLLDNRIPDSALSPRDFGE